MREEINDLELRIHRMEAAYDVTHMLWMLTSAVFFVFALGVGLEVETGNGLGAMAGSALLFIPLAAILRRRVTRLKSLREQLRDMKIIQAHERAQR